VLRFSRYGVTLARLDRDRVDLVRTWRNGAWVRPFMRHRRRLSEDDQQRWFSGLDPIRDWYFLAEADGGPFALFHVKDVDWQTGSGEAGGFVGHPDLLGGAAPAQATLALMDFAFLVLGLEALYARYRVSLPKMVRFNERLGYRAMEVDGEGFVHARIGAADYFRCASAYRQAAEALFGSSAVLACPGEWLTSRLGTATPRWTELEVRS
jgi:RimJ/RimL family protein N-acetyltransferase